MNLYEYQRSRSFIDLSPRSLRFNILKLLFLRNRQADWSQISCGASMGWENGMGYMTSMATMPIYVRSLNISSSLEPNGQRPWNVNSIWYSSTTKFARMMTLGSPWPILWQSQILTVMLLYRKFFRNYFNLWYQRSRSLTLTTQIHHFQTSFS